ncbi:exodeoxyribonuclease III [Altererythrobacter arenosus]|uniref:Exodeoxyribonuclease III n=1 Tax=Altererythrobacter arenosus TaxID=3032592 RepID=A0ABY8FUF8_9SPHN|nr:exodeoxyribonuclease III [Altererythrobacter sp. CAU 1644]WFL78641.1 exodeoxyribonuclease III [Altererythrobacter sp. CAU 1644]
MKIATFNINGIKARLPRLKEWLEETRPSVACLQEIKSQDDGFPAGEFEAIGYQAIWHGQKSFNGVAMLVDAKASFTGPVEVRRGLGIDGPNDGEGEQARYLEADVNGVRVVCIYLPNGNPHPGPKFDYKLAWMERLRERMAEIWAEEVPCAVVGDFNVIPHDDDVWSPKAMASDALMQPESRAAYSRLLADGWTDAMRTLNPRGGVWTYWDYQAGAWQRDHGFRIDHLLLSPELADRLEAVGVDKDHRGREKASDHAPVWVQLRN